MNILYSVFQKFVMCKWEAGFDHATHTRTYVFSGNWAATYDVGRTKA